MARDDFARSGRGQLFLLNSSRFTVSTTILLLLIFVTTFSHFATAQAGGAAAANETSASNDASAIDALAADAAIPVPTRARAFAAPSGPNAIDEAETENSERRAFFKVGGVRDGIQKAVFDEAGNGIQPDFDTNDNMGREVQFGTYDDNSVVDPRREIPLFIPLPYRNETEEEKAATATTKAPPTISPLRTRRPLVAQNLNNRAPIPVRTTPPSILISQQRVTAPFAQQQQLPQQQQQQQGQFLPQQQFQQQQQQLQQQRLPQFQLQQQQQFVPQQPQPQQFVPQQPQQQQFVPQQQQKFVPQQPQQQLQFVPRPQPPQFIPQQQQQQFVPQQQQQQQQQFRPQPQQQPQPQPQQSRPPQKQLPSQQQQFSFVPRLQSQQQRPRRPLPPTLQTQAPRVARPFQTRNNNFAEQSPRAAVAAPPPPPLAQNAQNVRTGVCANTIFYESVSAAPFDLHLTYSHFATVVSVDQCARTCHEFNCASALFDPSTRRCQFNPTTAFSVPQGTCPSWPNAVYRNNVRAGAQPLRIFCVTCQRRRRTQGARQPLVFRTTNRNRFEQRAFSRTVSNAAAHGVVLQQPRSVDINDKRLGENLEAFDHAKVEDGVEFGDGPLSPDAMRTTIKPSAQFAAEDSESGLRIPPAPLRIQQNLHSKILPIPIGKEAANHETAAADAERIAADAVEAAKRATLAAESSGVSTASAAAASAPPTAASDAAARPSHAPRTSVDASTAELMRQRHKRAARPSSSSKSSHVVASSALSVRDVSPTTKIAAAGNSA